jgi:hypothetical protein
MISINETLREEYWSQAGVLIIVLCMAFEDSSYGWNTALKFHDAFPHVITCDNNRTPLGHDAADAHTHHACLSH